MNFAVFIFDMQATRRLYQPKYANSGMETQALWDQELTEQETEELVSNLANQIRRRKLESPAFMFLEMHRPISRIAGNALVVFSPFVAPFVGFQNVQNYSRLLMEPQNVELLIQKLEVEPDSDTNSTPEEGA